MNASLSLVDSVRRFFAKILLDPMNVAVEYVATCIMVVPVMVGFS